MTKTRKKKNLKLKRRIKRTVASIIMIMAVTVAAIPVENLDRAQAAPNTKFDMNDIYETSGYSQRCDTSSYETGYTNTGVTVQTIKDDALVDAYKVDINPNNNDAIVSGKAGQSVFTIGKMGYFNYVYFDEEYVKDLKNQFNNQGKLEVKFSGTTENLAEKSYTQSDGTSATRGAFTVTTLNRNKYEKLSTDIKLNDITATSTEYTKYDGTALDVKLFFDNYIKDISEEQKAVDEYNKLVAEFKTLHNKTANVTADDVNRYNEIKSNIEAKRASVEVISRGIDEFTVDSNDNGIADILEYIICNHYQTSEGDDLKSCTLELMEHTSGSVYLAKYAPRKPGVDDKGYLVDGEVTIKGIKSGAFTGANKSVTDIVIEAPLTFIGNRAFYESDLTTLKLNTNACEVIGDEAFAGSDLSRLTFDRPNNQKPILKTIGTRAFAETLITEIEIPNTVSDIYEGCFERCSALSKLVFSSAENANGVTKIHDYAFYNCRSLTNVSFNNGKEYNLQKGVFALDSDQAGGALTNFAFPEKYVFDDTDDYMLAGRIQLENVTFPAGLNNTIPLNTLRGCYNLSTATFPETAKNVIFNQGVVDYQSAPSLFGDVLNERFYIIGPKYSIGTEPAQPRKLAWKAVAGHTDDKGNYAPVPYMYTDSSGVHFDVGMLRDGYQFVATVDAIDDNTAKLTKYSLQDNSVPSGYTTYVEIPDVVGPYVVIEIGEKCFDDSVKNLIYELIIKDGSIQIIHKNAFFDSSVLEKVKIGNSVIFIGSGAFSNCPKLEQVVFSQVGLNYAADDPYWTDLVIEDNAFNTQSNYLTFEGAINHNYAPFVIAMSENSSDMLATDSQICYKTGLPLNLTVMRDRNNGKATLIDYPHFNDLDSTLTDNFYEFVDGTADAVTSEELEIVNGTLNIELPSGIESIDSKSFYTGQTNAADFSYVKMIYEEKADGKGYERVARDSTNVKYDTIDKWYSVDKYDGWDSSYGDYIGDENVAIGGLFSGMFDESTLQIVSLLNSNTSGSATSTSPDGLFGRKYNDHEYWEKYDAGYDYLTSIWLTTVESLPAYAFDSNDNLLNVSLGADMSEMGALPFRGCKNLSQINIDESNKNFDFLNMILYQNNGDEINPNYEIVECLEGTGDVGGSRVIEDYLANVTSIAKRAFSNCENITGVDLTNTSVKVIPEGCFEGSSVLKEVKLPYTVGDIYTDAFLGVDYADFRLTVPNPNCRINLDAFDANQIKSGHITITSPMYINEDTGEYSAPYKAYLELIDRYGNSENIIFKAMGRDFTLDLIYFNSAVEGDWDRESYIITKNTDGTQTPDPETAYKTAKTFVENHPRDGYECIDIVGIVGGEVKHESEAFVVKDDNTVTAIYASNPDSVVSDGKLYKLTIKGGSAYIVDDKISVGDGKTVEVYGGKSISITAADADSFKLWTVQPNTVAISDVESPGAGFTMPNADVVVTANYDGDKDTDKDNDKDNDKDTDKDKENDKDKETNSTKKYKLTVNYGSGSGEYKAGESVSISAFAPESASKVFSKWTTNNSSVGFSNPTSANTSLVMPASDVTVTANYKVRVDDDDDDDESSDSRRPGTGSSTNVVSRPNGSSNVGNNGNSGGNSSGNNNVTTDKNGNKIYITKNGISNKDVASIAVSGSTDNFIVRITESEEATAAAKTALRNKYGSLDGLSYFPMDISLYDSTGQTKITDTYGLNITVTMPIPDVLIQYGGNARVAAADDGYLQEITPKFTTIDGIACISFVPPHFSPYVIYVDTNNLVAGQTFDSTPATGDPIHPKWFIAIGMACISVIMFATSDGRKRKNIKMA